MKKTINKWNLPARLRVVGCLAVLAAVCILTPTAIEAGCPTARAPFDFDGDNKTDLTIVRNTGGGTGGQVTWFTANSSNTPPSSAFPFGISNDTFVPADYDGDGKTDIAVWRSNAGLSAFYIMQSQSGTLRSFQFGQTGDQPRVTYDYTGDGKADPAIYRTGVGANNPSFWYYIASSGPAAGNLVSTQWGTTGDFPTVGDFDGDGRGDFAVQRNVGGSGVFYLNQTTAGFNAVYFGLPSDFITPGDYDGDCKTDIAVARTASGQRTRYIRRSTNGAVDAYAFGITGDSNLTGDFDGDGTSDVAIWRVSTTPGVTSFYWRNSTGGATGARQWGQIGDYPVANTYVL